MTEEQKQEQKDDYIATLDELVGRLNSWQGIMNTDFETKVDQLRDFVEKAITLKVYLKRFANHKHDKFCWSGQCDGWLYVAKGGLEILGESK